MEYLVGCAEPGGQPAPVSRVFPQVPMPIYVSTQRHPITVSRITCPEPWVRVSVYVCVCVCVFAAAMDAAAACFIL